MARAERMAAALLESGRHPRDVAWISRTLVYFVTGFVRDEQDAPDRDAGIRAAAVDASRFPAASRIAGYLGEDDREARYEYDLQLIRSGAGHLPADPADLSGQADGR